MKEKIPYFKLVKLVDQIFPSRSELDYTKITTEELVERVGEVIRSSGLDIDANKILTIQNSVRDEHRFIYGRTSNYIGNGKSPGYDQHNYFIQRSYIDMKNIALSVLTRDSRWIPLVRDGEYYNTLFFGDLELIESIVNKDNITNYVRDTLYITCSQNEQIDTSTFSVTETLRNIFEHFGLKADTSTINPKSASIRALKEAERLIESLIKEATYGIGNIHQGIEETGYVPYSDDYRTDSQKFNSKFETLVREISDKIATIALPALEMTKKEESIKEQQKAKQQQKKTEEKVTQKSRIVQPKRQTKNTSKKPVISEKLQDTIKKYEDLQKVIEENISLSKDLDAINQQIVLLEEQLAKLKAKKNTFEQKISNNEETIRRGLKG